MFKLILIAAVLSIVIGSKVFSHGPHKNDPAVNPPSLDLKYENIETGYTCYTIFTDTGIYCEELTK